MARIIGIDIQDNYKVWYGLTKIYGIGQKNVWTLLKEAEINPEKRVKELTDKEISAIQKVLEKDFKIEGDLRREIQENIKRLKIIGAYRGLRHSANLPSRGQRTRSNARTKRGKRKTIGAVRKDAVVGKAD